MPRLTRVTPKLCRVRTQAVVYLGGQAHYLGRYGSSEAKRRFRRLLAEWEAGDRPTQPAAATADLTITEVCQAFKRYAVATYRTHDGKPSGEIHPIKAAVKALRTLYGTTLAADFGPLKFKALRQQWIDQGLARGTVNRYANRIKLVFKWAVSEELVSPTVYQALSAVSGLRAGRTEARELEPVGPVDDATMEQTLPHLPSVVADMVRIQRLTGCRPGEICVLRPCDVDTSPGIWIYRPPCHKTAHRGKERTIAIGPKAQEVLRRYLLRPADVYCFSPCDSERRRRKAQHDARLTPISYGNRPGTNRKRRPIRIAGEHYTPTSYARAISRACEAAFGMPPELRNASKGLKSLPAHEMQAELCRRLQLASDWRSHHCWSPNQLRHACATEVRSKFGLEAAQHTLGHQHANVTQIYAERNLQMAIHVAQQVG